MRARRSGGCASAIPSVPYGLAGFSFGARVITRLGCAAEDASFLMAAGFPTRWGPPDYLENCTAPKIFIQSTNDVYGPRAELEALYERFAAPKELHWVEAARPLLRGRAGRVGGEGEASAEQL